MKAQNFSSVVAHALLSSQDQQKEDQDAESPVKKQNKNYSSQTHASRGKP